MKYTFQVHIITAMQWNPGLFQQQASVNFNLVTSLLCILKYGHDPLNITTVFVPAERAIISSVISVH